MSEKFSFVVKYSLTKNMNTLGETAPFFSVIIPCLNEEKTLPALLTDLINQTFKDFEVIVVDASSEDKTVSKINRFRKRINLCVLTSDKRNICFQRNLGAKSARSDWLIFFDADNRIPKYFLQGIKFYIEFLNADILTSHIVPDTKNSKDQAITKVINLAIDYRKSSQNPVILESMIVIKNKVFHKIGGFNNEIHWGEGTDLLGRIKKAGYKFETIKDLKYQYSFRRFRKQGTLKILRNLAIHEIALLANKPVPKDKAAKLYPLEGGKYFEVDSKTSIQLEKLFNKIIQNTPARELISNGKNGILKKMLGIIVKK